MRETVSKQWNDVARPFLWSNMRIGMPGSFETLLEDIADEEENDVEASAPVFERQSRSRRPISNPYFLTPPGSRETSPMGARKPSPIREASPLGLRQPSPMRGLSFAESFGAALSKLFLSAKRTQADRAAGPVISIDSAVQRFRKEASNPGLFIRQISFAQFRTHGMFRTIREGSQQRFVTPGRMLRLLRGTRAHGDLVSGKVRADHKYVVPEDASLDDLRGRMSSLGLTEYMDSSLTKDVLEELLLRGGVLVEEDNGEGRSIRKLSGSSVALNTTPLEAIDFCGCVSRKFLDGLDELIDEYELGPMTTVRPGSATKRSSRTYFPHCKRLGFFDASSIKPDALTAFVTSFPNLTHLDLAKTRPSPALLTALAETRGMQLQCLSLARCRGLTGASILRLLCGTPEEVASGVIPKHLVTAKLRDLSLNGDEANMTPLSREEMATFLSSAPCLRSGKLRALDISSCPLDDELIMYMPPSTLDNDGQLLILGLGCCRALTIEGVARFMAERASTVEVLDLTASCAPAGMFGQGNRGGRRAFLNVLILHTHLIKPITTGTLGDDFNVRTRKTNLRVIELEENCYTALQAGSKPWQIIYGKGQRGWYVHTGVTGSYLHGKRVLRPLDENEEEHKALVRLAAKDATVAADVGWNPRKMEILGGLGALGRENGLYAFRESPFESLLTYTEIWQYLDAFQV